MVVYTVLQCHHPSLQETVNTSVNETKSHHPVSVPALNPVPGFSLAQKEDQKLPGLWLEKVTMKEYEGRFGVMPVFYIVIMMVFM